MSDSPSMPTKEAIWQPRDTLIGTLLTLFPFIVLAVANAAAGAATTSATTTSDAATAVAAFIFTALGEAIFLIAPLYYSISRGGVSKGLDSLGFRSFHIGLAIGLLILSAMVAIIATITYGAISDALHIGVQTNADRLLHSLSKMPLTLRATLFGAVFIAPICEELFFRGFLLTGLRAVTSAPWAIIISGVVFAVAHGDLGSTPLLLVLGLLLGWLRVSTKSIWPGIILHTTNNAFTAIALLVAIK